MTASQLWFVVADGRRARVLAYDRSEDSFAAPLDFDYVASGATDGERFSDRAGRVHERVGPGRHGMEPHTSPNRNAEREMARRVARDLAGLVHERTIERLVLVAPPRTLGDLREMIDAPTRSKVVGEHGKDLSKLSEHELQGRLRELAGPS